MTDTELDKLHRRFKELHQELSDNTKSMTGLPLKFIGDEQDMIYDSDSDAIVNYDHLQRAYFEPPLAEYLLLAVQIAEEAVGKS